MCYAITTNSIKNSFYYDGVIEAQDPSDLSLDISQLVYFSITHIQSTNVTPTFLVRSKIRGLDRL